MADTYWDDSWGERLPFLESAPGYEYEYGRELSSEDHAELEQLEYEVAKIILEEE